MLAIGARQGCEFWIGDLNAVVDSSQASSCNGARLAAIQHSSDPETDTLLADVARRLKRGGYRVGGVVQSNVPQSDGRRCDMVLEELTSRQTVCISQQQGPGSRGCRLDSAALEHAVGLVDASLQDGLDVLVLNRFGKQEAEGRGFATTIAKAVDANVPILIAVKRDYAEAWHQFCGEEGQVLKADRRAVDQWIDASLLPAHPP